MTPQSRRLKRRLWLNFLADHIVRLGGGAVLLSISAIFLVILWEAFPIFLPTKVKLQIALPPAIKATPRYFSFFDNETAGFLVHETGEIRSFSNNLQEVRENFENQKLPLQENERITAIDEVSHEHLLFIATNFGRVLSIVAPTCREEFELPGALTPREVFDVRGSLNEGDSTKSSADVPANIFPEESAVSKLRVVKSGTTLTLAALLNSHTQEISLFIRKEQKSLMGAGKSKDQRGRIGLSSEKVVSSLELSKDGRALFLGFRDGSMQIFDLRDPLNIRMLQSYQVSEDHVPVTALRLLIGGGTLIVGDAAGNVSRWLTVGGDLFSGASFKQVSAFESHQASIVEISASRRNRTFLTADELGQMKIHYSTSGQTLARFNSEIQSPQSSRISTKGDLLSVCGKDGMLRIWSLQNPHPEASLGTLFSKVWYEGYAEPAYVWQSSSGSDESEPKLSLVPLIYGTLKGTLYSLLFAVPLAILGAIYTSEFMSPRMRNVVKPVIELMAALPSVVIGFVAGLWLAPTLAPYVPGLLLSPIVLILMTSISLFCWRKGPKILRLKIQSGSEFWLLIPVSVLSIFLAFRVGEVFESRLLHDTYQHWLLQYAQMVFDQRNSIVVGVAMGFAVIPLIFTIAEDSLGAVPQHLRAGSLALGASRWQTALNVVLPAASPGIFSAIMLGFGRAVGETMIVLMATGNTPIMDASPFNGFRALSATIAVELPEAAQGGTLFRVLFFAALLLFVFTFLINTTTEIIRQRLRKKYGQL